MNKTTESKSTTMPATQIKYIRKREELTQKAFAEKLGVSESTISNIEKGEREPSVYVIKKICEEFGYSSDFILDMKPPVIINDISIPIKDLFTIKERKHIHFKNTKQKITVEIYFRLTKKTILKIFDNYHQELLHYLGFIQDEQWEKIITGGIFKCPENKPKEILVHTFTYEV